MDNVVGAEGIAIFDGRTSKALTITHKVSIQSKRSHQNTDQRTHHTSTGYISMKAHIIIVFDQNQNGPGRCALELKAVMI